MKEHISVRQTGIIASLLLLVNKLLLLPSLLFKDAKADGFFVAFLIFVVELVFVFMFLKLKEKYKDQSLYQIISNLIGTFMTKFLFLVCCFVVFIKLMLLLNDTFVYLRDYVYNEATFLIYLICMLPAINFIVSSGLNALGRTCEFFFRFIIVGILFCIALGAFNIHGLPQVFNVDALSFFTGMFKNLFWFFDVLCLYVIIDKVEYQKDLTKKVFKYVGLTMLMILSLIFVFFSIYKITAFIHGNAIVDILMFASNYGGIGRLDIFAIVTMMFLVILEGGILLYTFASMMTSVFKITNFYSIIFFDIAFLVSQYSIFKNLESILWLSQNVMSYFIVALVVIIVILVSIGAIYTHSKRRKA